MAKSATAKRRAGPRVAAKRRSPKHVAVGASIQNLLLEGRAMDVADTMAGLHGSSCRTGRALNALLARYIDRVDPKRLSHEQALQLGELAIGISNANVLAHDSLVKALAPKEEGGRPAIDASPVAALTDICEKFRQEWGANG